MLWAMPWSWLTSSQGSVLISTLTSVRNANGKSPHSRRFKTYEVLSAGGRAQAGERDYLLKQVTALEHARDAVARAQVGARPLPAVAQERRPAAVQLLGLLQCSARLFGGDACTRRKSGLADSGACLLSSSIVLDSGYVSQLPSSRPRKAVTLMIPSCVRRMKPQSVCSGHWRWLCRLPPCHSWSHGRAGEHIAFDAAVVLDIALALCTTVQQPETPRQCRLSLVWTTSCADPQGDPGSGITLAVLRS